MKRGGGTRKRRDVAAKRGEGRERGVSAIEFVLLTPLLFFLIFATVQFAIYFYARHVAIAAAQEGDRVAREEAATNVNWSGDAVQKTNAWINQLASGLVDMPNAPRTGESGTRGAATWTVSVTVTATVHSLWGDMNVTETSAGPVEQFIPDSGD